MSDDRSVIGAKVEGYCPMGCGATLFTGAGGHVTCACLECPNPCAVDEILGERETEHIVVFDDDGFVIKHPLRERIEGNLFDCVLLGDLRSMGRPPAKPGRYRATPIGNEGKWHFAEVPSPDAYESEAA